MVSLARGDLAGRLHPSTTHPPIPDGFAQAGVLRAFRKAMQCATKGLRFRIGCFSHRDSVSGLLEPLVNELREIYRVLLAGISDADCHKLQLRKNEQPVAAIATVLNEERRWLRRQSLDKPDE